MFTSKHRTFVRNTFGLGTCTNIPVNINWGWDEPEIKGKSGGWFTHGGSRIHHPSAYSRKGWSNMMYLCSTRRINVGCFWLLKHFTG